MISYSEAKNALLSGQTVTWAAFSDLKSGSVCLSTAAPRRVLEFLLKSSTSAVARADEELFEGIIAAWLDSTRDPAQSQSASHAVESNGPWRLDKLETFQFGGLNTIGGPEFHLPVQGSNWCLEGQNGSGKTSIASALIWAITGLRVRDQDGVFFDDCRRTIVKDDSGSKVGDWPAIVSYPPNSSQLSETAIAWVRATFQDNDGNTAIAYRRVSVPPNSDPEFEIEIDPQLQISPQLIETGLLMPARLARIGFGEKSESIYEAVKLLTGLDQLSDVGEGAANLSHRSKRFLKYAQDHGIKTLDTKIESNLAQVQEKSADAQFEFAPKSKLGDEEYPGELRSIAKDATALAGQHLETLKSDIAPELDTSHAADREKICKSVDTARGILQNAMAGIPLFESWTALAKAPESDTFHTVQNAIESARERLSEAEKWNKRQQDDQRLRLKALAATFFEAPDHNHEDADCPLCRSKLTGEERSKLAAELAELKKSAEVAEQKISDVCARLEKQIRELLPTDIQKHFEFLATMQPRDAFEEAALEKFSIAPPFSDTLLGMASFTASFVADRKGKLPLFEYASSPSSESDVESVAKLHAYLDSVERIAALTSWWKDNRPPFRNAWSDLKGKANSNGEFYSESLEGKLAALESALEKAAPLDSIAKLLKSIAVAAEEWTKIQEHQSIRQDIAKALEPLKDLRNMVAVQTAESISSLSGQMKNVLDRIHFQERLTFQDARLDKKSVQISGSFEHGLRIDASTVANSSWLRAILWSFVFALREKTIELQGNNPFPLTLMDDPQVSFDPRNKRKWAEEIARLANLDASDANSMQLILTTHERQFFQMLVNIEKLSGEQGLIMRPNGVSKVATVVNGTALAQTLERAISDNDDALGHYYVLQVRTYCEDLLKVMLRTEGPHIANGNLDSLRKELKRLNEASVAPFNRMPFEKLLKIIESGAPAIQYLNAAHHQHDGTIGVAQAKDVSDYWQDKIQSSIHNCFKVFAEFESYTGEPRTFPWMDNVVSLPTGTKDKLGKFRFNKTCVAAAAKTDGRAGDGTITVQDLASPEEIRLPNHEVYQLAAGTLDPIAAVGDAIIVSNYAKVHDKNLVVTAFGEKLLARRFNESELHPHLSILTGEALDPYSLPQPIVAAKERTEFRKVVGTLFLSHMLPVPRNDENYEIISIPDLSKIQSIIDGADLFQVQGRSAEPIALDGQYLMARQSLNNVSDLKSMDGRLVVAVDENGASFFKRIRLHEPIVILESLNPDGTTPSVVISLSNGNAFSKIVEVREVIGVLFELP